jgi:hypothetical protein
MLYLYPLSSILCIALDLKAQKANSLFFHAETHPCSEAAVLKGEVLDLREVELQLAERERVVGVRAEARNGCSHKVENALQMALAFRKSLGLYTGCTCCLPELHQKRRIAGPTLDGCFELRMDTIELCVLVWSKIMLNSTKGASSNRKRGKQ